MQEYWVRYVPKALNKPSREFETIKAKSITGAKRIASRLYPTVKGTWNQDTGFDYSKSNATGTIHLYIPYSNSRKQ